MKPYRYNEKITQIKMFSAADSVLYFWNCNSHQKLYKEVTHQESLT